MSASSIDLRFIFGEAQSEFRSLMRGPTVGILFGCMTAYMLLILVNADYMREMGAIGIPRNSAYMFYLMASGQALWLFFSWAWVFSQSIGRDQQAQLHEIVLAAPISLKQLLFARYLGALGVALILGFSTLFGIIISPILETVGILPAGSFGPTPWLAAGWAYLIYIVTNAMAFGAIFIAAAMWTRSSAGSFVVAAALALIWMVAMIVFRGGDVDLFMGSLLDPAGYAEAERQSFEWTPAEKQSKFLELTPALLANRALWGLAPLAIAALVWLRVSREYLAIERKSSEKAPKKKSKTTLAPDSSGRPATSMPQAPNWIGATLKECFWHLKVTLGGFGFRLALVMATLCGVLGAWVNFIGHSEGPMNAHPQAIMPFMAEFFFIFIQFVLVGFLGVLMRRDEQPGFGEWVDASRAPLGVRVIGKALAGLGMTIILCCIPALATVVLSITTMPEALNIGLPFSYALWYIMPAILELAVVILLLHAMLSHAGMAYTLSIVVVFISIINHELSVVEYPLAQYGIPLHASFFEITGWAPWFTLISAVNVFKGGIICILFALAWMGWRRGTALVFADRLRAFGQRLFGAPGIFALASLLVSVLSAWVIFDKLVEKGEFESSWTAVESEAEWEIKWWDQAAPFSLTGGEVAVKIDPWTRSGTISWSLENLTTPDGQLHATVPHGLELEMAKIEDVDVPFELDGSHLVLDLQAFPGNHQLNLEFSVKFEDWPNEEHPWLMKQAVYLRAENVLPILGHDPERLVDGVTDRVKHGLPETQPAIPVADALTPVLAVAPSGIWSWQIEVDGEQGLSLGSEGSTEAPLDFAFVWLANPKKAVLREGAFDTLHGPARVKSYETFEANIAQMIEQVESRLDVDIAVNTVLHAPRELGEVRLHGDILWIPEDEGWDVTGVDRGLWNRQYDVAHALAKRALVDQLDVRNEVGARWLIDGVAGWVALNSLEAQEGRQAATEYRVRLAERIVEAFGTTGEPITTIADSKAEWVALYATLALDSWSRAANRIKEMEFVEALQDNLMGDSLHAAISATVGEEDAAKFLGVPRAYDASVSETDGKLHFAGQRWTWQSGGWEPYDQASELMLRTAESVDDLKGVELELAQVFGSTESEENEIIYVFDSEPGFERTLQDNMVKRSE